MARKMTQYDLLSPIGKELHDYWMKFKPEMYRQMEKDGTLWEVLMSEDERLDDMVLSLIHNGMTVEQALEVARAEIYEEE